MSTHKDRQARAWTDLQSHVEALKSLSLRDLWQQDPNRGQKFLFFGAGLGLDLSKVRWTDETFALLIQLAKHCDVESFRDRMLAGDHVNVTERRAALHTALRQPSPTPLLVDGQDCRPEITEMRARLQSFVQGVHSGEISAGNGNRFTDVVNIGIGGSDLGPAMATAALPNFRPSEAPRLHFVSNVDGSHFEDAVRDLVPSQTLVLIASKTFTTRETMINAAVARDWLRTQISEDQLSAHLAGMTTNAKAAVEFGLLPDRLFGFADWVGGRYSIWSAIGLPLALAIGWQNFSEFLSGGAEMDAHFSTAALHENLPVLLALVGVLDRNGYGWPTRVICPYDQRLARLPAYLQQLEMESNGKQVERSGGPVLHATCPVIWGEPGTGGQHAFFQLLHQGTDIHPIDFFIAAKGPNRHQHLELAANCFAQSEAFAFGRTLQEVKTQMKADGATEAEIERLAPHRVFSGNRPSTTLFYEQLDPATLGRLIALYEHKVCVQGALWGINSFDQWGVELGKTLAIRVSEALQSPENATGPNSDLIRAWSQLSQRSLQEVS